MYLRSKLDLFSHASWEKYFHVKDTRMSQNPIAARSCTVRTKTSQTCIGTSFIISSSYSTCGLQAMLAMELSSIIILSWFEAQDLRQFSCLGTLQLIPFCITSQSRWPQITLWLVPVNTFFICIILTHQINIGIDWRKGILKVESPFTRQTLQKIRSWIKDEGLTPVICYRTIGSWSESWPIKSLNLSCLNSLLFANGSKEVTVYVYLQDSKRGTWSKQGLKLRMGLPS